jgi:isocitrate/isopropylmalate dehydrogenase
MLSGVMLLRHLGETEAADGLRKAIFDHLARGRTLTPDMGGKATTAEVRDAIRAELKALREAKSVAHGALRTGSGR